MHPCVFRSRSLWARLLSVCSCACVSACVQLSVCCVLAGLSVGVSVSLCACSLCAVGLRMGVGTRVAACPSAFWLACERLGLWAAARVSAISRLPGRDEPSQPLRPPLADSRTAREPVCMVAVGAHHRRRHPCAGGPCVRSGFAREEHARARMLFGASACTPCSGSLGSNACTPCSGSLGSSAVADPSWRESPQPLTSSGPCRQLPASRSSR